MNSKTAWIFPGQGSQYAGMGAELPGLSPFSKQIFDQADQALDMPLSQLCFHGPDEELRKTAITQPAVLTVSIAAMVLLKDKGLRPDFVAGHSLGEYSALVAAGAMEFNDALRIVRRRGTYMQEAVPEGVGAMAAIIGLDANAVGELCERSAGADVLSAANRNGPDQIVVAGHAQAVERLMALARENGAKRVVPLDVSAPFHCSLMSPAAGKLAVDLERIPIQDPSIPVLCNVRAKPVQTAAQVRQALIDQIPSPVLWYETVTDLIRSGVGTFVELGPGKVLSGLVRRIDRGVACMNIEDEKSLTRTLKALGIQ